MDNCLQIIGDKKGVGASRSLLQERKRVSFEELKKIVNVPIKFIHVYRNPYDNVATMVLRSNDQRYQASQSEYKVFLKIMLFSMLLKQTVLFQINHDVI